jgi:hypothetical protein
MNNLPPKHPEHHTFQTPNIFPVRISPFPRLIGNRIPSYENLYQDKEPVMIMELILLLGLFVILIISIGYQALSAGNDDKVVFMLDDLVFVKKPWKGLHM